MQQVKRQVEKINAARFTPLHPKETVRNIFFGDSYSLELYKSFTDKIELIDEAIELGDGNAILVVSISILNVNKEIAVSFILLLLHIEQ